MTTFLIVRTKTRIKVQEPFNKEKFMGEIKHNYDCGLLDLPYEILDKDLSVEVERGKGG